MKKLMKAVAAAVVALVASSSFATLPSPAAPVGFDALTAGTKYTVSQFVERTDAGETGDPRYWYAITNASQDASAELATINNDSAQGNYLTIEAQAPLYRTINASGNFGGELPAEVEAEEIPASGIYLDTMVKFTVSSDEFKDGDLDAADKLAITCYSADDDNVTNIIVRAGYVGSSVVATNYVMELPANFDVDAWHRLTVRAIANVGSQSAPVGFAVYLDQNLLTYGTDVAAGNQTYTDALNAAVKQNLYNGTTHALLPSLVASGATGAGSITAVGFKGTGSLDNIQFTNVKPGFIVEGIAVSIDWDAGVDTYTVVDSNNKTLVDAAATSGAAGSTNLTLDAGVTYLTVTAMYANGYEAGTWTVTGEGAQISGSTFTVANGAALNIVSMLPKFDVGGVHYGTFAEALAAAVASETTATIKLMANISETISFSTGNIVVLDLCGMTIQGGDNDDYTINNNGATLTITNSVAGGEVKKPTKTNAAGALYTDDGSTTIDAGKFSGTIFTEKMLDPEASGDIIVNGGSFYDPDYDPEDQESAFYLKDYVADGVTATYSNGYFTVGEQPVIGTFTVTVDPTANATYAAVYNDGGATVEFVNNVAAVTVGQTITITATPASGYGYASAPEGWTLNNGVITKSVSQAAEVAIPAPAEINWAYYLGAAVGGAYEIDNLAELKDFQANVGTLATAGETFKLTADIALVAPWPGIGLQNGKDVYSDAAKFDPYAFQGTFDGQDHTISGFQMVGGGLDYCGFFNSIYNATIKNLKIQYKGSLFAVDTTENSSLESGATFVGVAKNSTLINLTTLAGTVSCDKGFGGIVGYLTSGTLVDSCTNNVNMTSLKPNKCGGIAMITQGGSAVTIQNCQNNGSVAGSGEIGSAVGYIGLDTTISNFESTVAYKMFQHQGSTVTLQGTIKGNATVASYSGQATPGLNFATVDGSVATFVADDALALNGEYKVLGAGTVAATFAFAEAGTISFDTNLTQNVTFDVTAPGLDLTDATANGVVTFTAKAPSSDDWDDNPADIPAGTTAAEEYTALAGTALATADAKKLTTWAKAKNVEFSDVKTDADSYVDAFLLNCAPADVETAKENFKATITVNADGTVTVTAPGDYNVTPTIQGKQSLSDAEWHTKTDGDKFFRAVLSL